MARKLTFALAASFQDYSKRVKEAEEKNGGSGCDTEKSLRKKFAIDLRTPEEMQQDMCICVSIFVAVSIVIN